MWFLTATAAVDECSRVKLSCEACGSAIPARDVNLENLVAKCAACDAVFSIAGKLARRGVRAPDKQPPLPRGMRIVKAGRALPGEAGYRKSGKPRQRSQLVVERRWFGPHYLFLVFFCIGWDSFLVFWYSRPVNNWFFYVFPIAHLAMGVSLTYYTLAGLLNKTTLRIAKGVLSVRHGPLPWRGNRRLPVDRIRQLYVRKRVHEGQESKSVTYDVHVEDDQLARVKLLTGLHSLEQAEFIEWVVEDHLGIEDAATPASDASDPE